MTWTKYSVSYSDAIFLAASDTAVKSLFSLAAGEKITGVVIKASQPFSGAGLAAVAVSVGSGVDPGFYSPEFDILQALGKSYSIGGAVVDQNDPSVALEFSADGDFGSGSATFLTAGVLDVWIKTGKVTTEITVKGASRFSAANNWNAISSAGLVAAYDMVTIEGATLKDISGNGNDGTINGATPTASGLVFDGNDDYVSLPALIGNSDCMVLAIAHNIFGASTGYIWAESHDTDALTLISFTHRNDGALFRDADNNGNGVALNPIPFDRQYHAYYLRREGRTAGLGVIDTGALTTADLGALINVETNLAALGARDSGASRDNFWEGTLAYVLIFDRALSDGELGAAYEQIRRILQRRRVLLPRLLSPLRPGPVWDLKGAVLSKTLAGEEPHGCFEPSVIREGNAQILSGTVFKIWYTGAAGGIFYAESNDGLSWTKLVAPSPVINSHALSHVLKVDSTYYCFAENIEGSGLELDVLTSPDGITWTLLAAAVLTRGDDGEWDDINPYNVSVLRESPTLWRLLYEALGSLAAGTGEGYQTGGATSRDGVTWTKSPNNPLSFHQLYGMSGPQIYKIGGVYWAWGQNVNVDNPVSDIIRWRADDFNGPWQHYPSANNGVVLARGNGPDEAAQVADPVLLEVDGRTYMFYEGGETSEGPFVIKLAIADMPLSEVVKTSEGVIIFAITTSSPLPTATEAEPYTKALATQYGTAPFSWAIIDGALPAGLAIDPDDGTISGTPTEDGLFNFTVEVTDDNSKVATKEFSLEVEMVGGGLIAHWELEDETDSFGSNDLTNHNGVTFTAAGDVGKNVAVFDGVNQWLSHADNADLSLGDISFTLALRVLLRTAGAIQFIVGKDDTGAGREFGLYEWNSGFFRFFIHGAGDAVVNSNEAYVEDLRYELIIWRDKVAGTINIQVDGNTPASASDGGKVIPDGGADWTIGMRGDNALFLDGEVDRIKFYKRVLSAEERATVFDD